MLCYSRNLYGFFSLTPIWEYGGPSNNPFNIVILNNLSLMTYTSILVPNKSYYHDNHNYNDILGAPIIPRHIN